MIQSAQNKAFNGVSQVKKSRAGERAKATHEEAAGGRLEGGVPEADALSAVGGELAAKAGEALSTHVGSEAAGNLLPRRRFTARTFHSLRHCFVSELANRGVSKELRMKLAGHTTEAVANGYTHHETETLRAAVNLIPKG